MLGCLLVGDSATELCSCSAPRRALRARVKKRKQQLILIKIEILGFFNIDCHAVKMEKKGSRGCKRQVDKMESFVSEWISHMRRCNLQSGQLLYWLEVISDTNLNDFFLFVHTSTHFLYFSVFCSRVK